MVPTQLVLIFLTLVCVICANNDKTVPTMSIIDVLSSNESFSDLISILQKSDLIDYVNTLENVTFLAPINSAFANHDIKRGSKMSMDELNRFIIDEPIFRDYINGISILSTLNNQGSPFLKGFQIPILLDHHIEPDENGELIKEVYFIENANVISNDTYLSTIDSVVLTIDDLLIDPKESICTYFLNSLNRNTGNEHFKLFSSLLISDNSCQYYQFSNTTILLPSDNSLHLTPVERKYLLNIRGLNDKSLLLSNFILPGIIGGNLYNKTIETTNMNNEVLEISSSELGDELIINNKIHSSASNYLLSDGIIHYFNHPIYNYSTNDNFPVFTPRKYLIGLQYEEFVDEIDFRQLSSLIDDNSINQTILVSNDYYQITENLQNRIKYHFIEGNDSINLTNTNYKLLTSKLCYNEDGEKFCQKIKLEKSSSDPDKLLLNSNIEILNKQPYIIGNSSIYILDDDITIPNKLQIALASELTGHSKSIEFFKKFGLLKSLSKGNDEVYTIFFPSSKLWNGLDLVLDYLLKNDNSLKLILENFIIKGSLIYHDFDDVNKTCTTYSDNEIIISKIDDDVENDITVLQIDDKTFEISFDDEILYSNGVVHPINDNLIYPDNIEITTSDLLNIQDSNEFLNILDKLNLSSYIHDNSYSIMLPTTKSLFQENITHLLSDIKYLENFAKLHILPPGSLNDIINCYNENGTSTLIPTLLNNTHLTCRQLESGDMMLSITEGSKNEIRILRKGLTIPETEILSGILLIDRPINPIWLNKSNNKLYLHLPLFSIFLGILIGALFVILLVTFFLLTFDTSKNNKGFNGGNNNNDDNIRIVNVNEATPLLNDNMIDDHDDFGDTFDAEEDNNYNEHFNEQFDNLDEYNKQNDNNKSTSLNSGKSLRTELNNARVPKIKKYNTFDSNYSTNALAEPIDMKFNQV